jgi:Ca2+:H+ antiporter
VLRKALFASLALAPITVALHYLVHPPETVEFVLAAISLIPLAWLIGEATEHAAEHTGPGIGGFLNATFGNAPELIIALIAVNDGLTDVVRGSLSGSVIGNLLLVLGASLVAGGKGMLDRFSSFLSLGLVAFATLLFLVPSIPAWGGDPDTDGLAKVSAAISIVLLLVYVVVTWYSLRRHTAMHVASDDEIEGWSLRMALVVLGIATVVTALIAEILVGSLEVFAEKVGLSEFFVSAVIVAIVGNAAEHGGASSSRPVGRSRSRPRSPSRRPRRSPSSSSRPSRSSRGSSTLSPELPARRDCSPRGIGRLRGAHPRAGALESSARLPAARRLLRRRRRVLRRGRPHLGADSREQRLGINSDAREMSSSVTSRWVTARMTVGWIVVESPTPASTSRASASGRRGRGVRCRSARSSSPPARCLLEHPRPPATPRASARVRGPLPAASTWWSSA